MLTAKKIVFEIIAVSYTHLDVYKRQVHASIEALINCFNGCWLQLWFNGALMKLNASVATDRNYPVGQASTQKPDQVRPLCCIFHYFHLYPSLYPFHIFLSE